MSRLQDTIFKGLDNPVIIPATFSGDFTGWSDFTDIVVDIGNESYSIQQDPQQLFINGNELRLKIGDTTSLEPGQYYLKIVGFSAAYDDGYLITDKKFLNLPPVTVRLPV